MVMIRSQGKSKRRRKKRGKSKKEILVASAGIALLASICLFTLPHLINPSPEAPTIIIIAGGNLHTAPCMPHASATVVSQNLRDKHPPNPYISRAPTSVTDQEDNIYSERFQRPSKALPHPNPYSFKDFQNQNGASPPTVRTFNNPEDLILAYYGILRDASNMLGYSGGCGTIGMSELPYPYAYELLTKEKQEALSLDQFVDSFEGIGYTTLLKLLPAYIPPGTPPNTKYYMVETEVITGMEANTEQEYGQGSRFAYYYGLLTTEETDEGWKIKDICYISEDFLCAPMHGWFYLADAVIQIVYGDNLKLIDRIDRIEQNDPLISVYASGKDNSYRFDFVRLTNGYDILLHEYILENGAWVETSLLTDNWKYMKLSAERV